MRETGLINFVNGEVQSLCDWKSSCFAWKGSPSVEKFTLGGEVHPRTGLVLGLMGCGICWGGK